MKWILTKYKQGIGVFGLEENSLVEANIYDMEQEICIGDIYLGRVNKILPNIDACFVQIGGGKEIFLPFSETHSLPKSGDSILIQIKKEASKGKQPMGTMRLSVSGLYCVVNFEPHSIEVSSKLCLEQRKYWKEALNHFLTLEEISSEYKNLLSKYCVIVRTNVSENVNVSEVVSEWISLAKQMDFIVSKGSYQSLYTKLYTENRRYLSKVKNIPQGTIEEIITDDIKIFEELKATFDSASKVQEKIRFYQDDFSLQKLYSLETKLQEALNKKVWLKCGGFLMIEPTEALTVIDVNSGKFEKKGSPEDYYKKVNEEAATEIAKQLKLRNISGIIIIDFINMKIEQNKKELLEKLSDLFSKDSVKTQVIGMTSLGLVEITRTKVEKPLYEQLYE